MNIHTWSESNECANEAKDGAPCRTNKVNGSGSHKINRINKLIGSLHRLVTYIVNSVDEGIIAGIAHCQPVETEKQNVYVFVSEIENSV